MFPFSLPSFRRVFGYALCLSLLLGACRQTLAKNTAQLKLPRYCASAETTRAHLQRLFPKQKIVKYELQLPRKGELLFTSGGHNFISSNGERWFYDLTSGDWLCFEDTARDKDLMAFRSHCTKEELRQLEEQNRAKAIAWAEQYLRVWLPEWQKHRLVTLWFPPADTDVVFQEHLPCGAVNAGYGADVAWDPRTGRPLQVQMCYRSASPRIPLVTHISQEAAVKLAEDAVKRLPGVRWHKRIDPYEPFWKDYGLTFRLETDGLGIQRLVYGFWFAFWRGDASVTPEQYEGILQQKEVEISDQDLMPNALIAVDAMDGEVLPLVPSSAQELDALKIKPALYLDGARTYLNYMPRIEKGEPYLYIGYLNNTPLWRGKVQGGGEDRFRITYAGRTASVTPNGVEVRSGNRILHRGKAALIYKDKVYLPYKSIAALTGDTLRWNTKTERLDINTVPLRQGKPYFLYHIDKRITSRSHPNPEPVAGESDGP